MWLNRKQVEKIKEEYPIGTRIRLNCLEDPFVQIPPGTKGTVTYVDDQGQLSMKWDNGGSLSVIPGEDSFTVISKPDVNQETIRVLVVEPGKAPEVRNIGMKLQDMQAIVDGYIEEIYLDNETVMICNEEGKLKELPANRRLGNDIIAGSFFIAGDNGGESLVSLTDDQLERFQNQFQEIEEISQQEMMNAMTYKFYGGM